MNHLPSFPICQSCNMPMTQPEQFGNEADGTQSKDYCIYCYKDGAFTTEETMEGMISFCAPFEVKAGLYPDEATALKEMPQYYRQLKRWKQAEKKVRG